MTETDTYPLLSQRQPAAEPLPVDFTQVAEAIRQMERTIQPVCTAFSAAVKRAADESVALLPGRLEHAFKPDFDLACTVRGCIRSPEQH